MIPRKYRRKDNPIGNEYSHLFLKKTNLTHHSTSVDSQVKYISLPRIQKKKYKKENTTKQKPSNKNI